MLSNEWQPAAMQMELHRRGMMSSKKNVMARGYFLLCKPIFHGYGRGDTITNKASAASYFTKLNFSM